MSDENLNVDEVDIELTDEQLEEIAGGASGKMRQLVCDTCGYRIAANVAGVQQMVKHCSSQHNNSNYHTE